jgi:hypothetical protein
MLALSMFSLSAAHATRTNLPSDITLRMQMNRVGKENEEED